MSMVINTNIMSINAQNNLRTSQSDMNSAMERLSSGKRVNSAADDAAGLAIINRFTSQERGLNMAIRNANDGISMIQTAEGALDETTNILQRMRELSIQSANGIYSDANRATLQAEVSQLQDELTRIAETTSFNGLKILDGTLGDLELQVGAESGERLSVNLGDGFTAEALGTNGVSAENTGTFELSQSVNGEQSGISGTLNAIGEGELLINGVAVPDPSTFDDQSTSDAGASALGLAAAINSLTTETGVTATAVNEINLGDIEISNWVSLGALTITDADPTGGAQSATIVGGSTAATDFTAGGAGVDVTDSTYNFAVQIGDTTVAVDLSSLTTTAKGADIAASIKSQLDAGFSSTFTVSWDDTAEKFSIVDTSNVAGVGESMTVINVGSNSNLLELEPASLTTADSTYRTDADQTIPIAAGELFVNGKDMAGTYTAGTSQTALDAFANELTAKYGAGITFDMNAGVLVAQSTTGGDITISSSGAFASGDTFSLADPDLAGPLAAQAYGTGAASQTYTNAGADLDEKLIINDKVIDGFVKTKEDLVAAINAETAATGVTASLDTNALVLTSSDGRNIEIKIATGGITAATEAGATSGQTAGITLTDFDLSTADTTGQTYSGKVTLNGSNIELSGTNTGGFSTQTTVSALTTVAGVNGADTFASLTTGDLSINGYTVEFSTTAFTGNSVADDDDSAQAIAYAINTTSGLNDEVEATALTVMNLGEITAGSLTDLDLTINGKLVSFSGDLLAGDSDGNLVGTINSTIANGGTSTAEGIVASINADNELILTAEDGRNIDIQVTVAGTGTGAAGLFKNIDASTQDTTGFATKGTIVLTAKDGFSVSDVSGDKAYLAGIVNAGGDSIADIDISTQQGAQDAIAVVDRALDYIADARGDLGAASNRLDFTINNLSSVVENAAAARSRVQDTDFAVESAALARAQVLQQAGTAMLAQANAAPQQVLSLLQ